MNNKNHVFHSNAKNIKTKDISKLKQMISDLWYHLDRLLCQNKTLIKENNELRTEIAALRDKAISGRYFVDAYSKNTENIASLNSEVTNLKKHVYDLSSQSRHLMEALYEVKKTDKLQ